MVSLTPTQRSEEDPRRACVSLTPSCVSNGPRSQDGRLSKNAARAGPREAPRTVSVTGDPITPRFNDFFQQHLEEHKPRNPRTTYSATDWNSLEKSTQSFLAGVLEDTTWDSYSRVWADLERFAMTHHRPMNEWTSVVWLYHLITDKDRNVGLSAIYQYAKTISAVAGRQDDDAEWPGNLLAAAKKVLTKMGARIPDEQAEPATKEEVMKFVRTSRERKETKLLIYLAWKSASRADDMRKLNPHDITEVTHQGRPLIILRWRPKALKDLGSGRLKNGGNGLGHSCVVDMGEDHREMMDFLKTRQRCVTEMSTEEMGRILKKIRPDLSAHSLKRGALQHVIKEGVPLEVLVELARHSSERIPEQTRLYLPPVALALALRTHEATRLL